MRELLFWGATSQARVLAELIHGTDLRLVALVDNQAVPPPFPNIPVLNGTAGLDAWLLQRGTSDNLYCAVAVGGPRGEDRLSLMKLLKTRGLTPISLIHRTAFVAYNATVGEGCQILAQSAVCTDVQLGRSSIINTGASVDHDCKIGDGAHIAPGARLAGEITVGASAFIGAGAVILPRLSIGEGAVIGAGAVVTKNVAPGATMIGNPARPKV